MPTTKSSLERAYEQWRRKKRALRQAIEYLNEAFMLLDAGAYGTRGFRKYVPSHGIIVRLGRVLKKAQRIELGRILRNVSKKQVGEPPHPIEEFSEFLHTLDRVREYGDSVYLARQLTRLTSLVPRLGTFLEKTGKDLSEKISKIPASIEKAENYLRAAAEFTPTVEIYNVPDIYEAIIYLDNHGCNISKVLRKITKEWQEAERRAEERRSREETGASEETQPSSAGKDKQSEEAEGMPLLFHVCTYRFWRHFPNDAIAIAVHLAKNFEFEGILLKGEPEEIAFEMSFLSRTKGIGKELLEATQAFLVRILRQQKPNGCWSTPYARDGHPQLTAENSLLLLRWGGKQKMRKSGNKGAWWLLERQSPEGFWTKRLATEDEESREKTRHEPSILASCLATQAIIEAGIVKSRHTLELVRDWLLEQQKSVGCWNVDHRSPMLSTVIVLQTLKAIEAYKPKAEAVVVRKEPEREKPAAFVIYTNQGREEVSAEKHEELYRLKDQGKFQLFIDVIEEQGFSRIKGKLKEVKLSRDEVGCLAWYMKNPGISNSESPYKTPAGKERASIKAATKLFTRARAKVDFQMKGTKQYRWFKTYRDQPGKSLYYFDPKNGRYCLIEKAPPRS